MAFQIPNKQLAEDEEVKSRIKRILKTTRLVWPIVIFSLALLSALLLGFFMSLGSLTPSLWLPVFVTLALLAVIGFVIAATRMRNALLRPLAHLEMSIAHICQGETGDVLKDEQLGVFDAIAKDLGSINDELTDLYEDMDSRVARQTTRLAQKTASLKILYDVAATINQANDLDDLLLRFLRVLKEMVNGKAATVRLCTSEQKMRLVGSIGLEDVVLTEKQMLPVQLCICGTALTPGDILCSKDPVHCSRINGRKMFGNDEIEVVSVPLEYHNEKLGNYSIFVEKRGITQREDIMELLSTIGSHLGMAVAKQRSDADAHRLSLIKERTNFAHELHDSLAQTLASLRFQVRMMDDALSTTLNEDAAHDLERIRNGLDEAHIELRELINNFRAPLDERGLIQSLEKLTERFGQETGIHAFFQRDCSNVVMPVSLELQFVRIVQEALANIRKHAKAETVRVLLRCDNAGTYRILVEDDGIGFVYADKDGNPGEHIGLSIMEERALKIGAEFKLESEEGEGTRVELLYRKPDAGKSSTLMEH